MTEEENISQLQLIREGYKGNDRKPGKDRPWDRNRGNQSGIQALKNARRVYGKDGEGVREYGKLILQLLSGDETIDATEMIRREVGEEDARIISELLKAET